MWAFGKFLGRLIALLAVICGALWIFGPYESVDTEIRFDAAALGDDPAAYLAAQEARFDDITPGTEKRIIWAGEEGVKTPLSVVYIHGYSATSEEIRPVPDMVAEALGANIHYTRISGHGRGGDALAGPTVQDWLDDTAEALAVARAIGDEVIVISTSTGGTLIAMLTEQPAQMEQIKGMVFVSPNFGINNPMAGLLTWPAARYWAPIIAGRERSFETVNDLHATYWTTKYPSVAALPVAASVQYAEAMDYSGVMIPALWLFSDLDGVVRPDITRRIAGEWGGSSTIAHQDLPEGQDPWNHVIAGEALSPAMNGPVSGAILDWLDGLM